MTNSDDLGDARVTVDSRRPHVFVIRQLAGGAVDAKILKQLPRVLPPEGRVAD